MAKVLFRISRKWFFRFPESGFPTFARRIGLHDGIQGVCMDAIIQPMIEAIVLGFEDFLLLKILGAFVLFPPR